LGSTAWHRGKTSVLFSQGKQDYGLFIQTKAANPHFTK